MRMGWSPRPVFAFESLAATRRWQVYALRCVYVGLLLLGLTLTWGPSDRTIHSLAEVATIAGVFFRTLIAVQLVVVLLAAPAATASAVCVDKARGTLLHAFVTDLTDREIVLGKLGARLAPVLALMACGLPVLALGSFLGGIDLIAALGAELVTVGTAVVCCSLALLASVLARKPHQALLLAYLLVGLWVATAPVVHVLFLWGPPASTTAVIMDLGNPIFAAFAPDLSSPLLDMGLREQVAFFLAALVVAVGIVGLATRWLRPTVLSQVEPPGQARATRCAGAAGGLPAGALARRQSGPLARVASQTALALDRAVLDGICRRLDRRQCFRPRRLLYLVGRLEPSTAASLGWLRTSMPGRWRIGLLLLSVSAATTLAEERDRGSLEVIMATPLTTREIVWGKWWGTFAMVPRLAILPIWVAGGAAMVSDGGAGLIFMIGLILAYAAAITSVGLALATWIPRLGRVISITVMVYVLIAAGWPLLLQVLPFLPAFRTNPWQEQPVWDGLSLASPFYGIYAMTESASRLSFIFPGYSPWRAPSRLAQHSLAPLLDRCILRNRHDPDVRDIANLRPLNGAKSGTNGIAGRRQPDGQPFSVSQRFVRSAAI